MHYSITATGVPSTKWPPPSWWARPGEAKQRNIILPSTAYSSARVEATRRRHMEERRDTQGEKEQPLDIETLCFLYIRIRVRWDREDAFHAKVKQFVKGI